MPQTKKAETAAKLEEAVNTVIRQMMNPEKNNYDSEIELPEWIPSKSCADLLNTEYRGCRNNDSHYEEKT